MLSIICYLRGAIVKSLIALKSIANATKQELNAQNCVNAKIAEIKINSKIICLYIKCKICKIMEKNFRMMNLKCNNNIKNSRNIIIQQKNPLMI